MYAFAGQFFKTIDYTYRFYLKRKTLYRSTYLDHVYTVYRTNLEPASIPFLPCKQ